MSEWNAFRGWPLHGGWSGRAGIGLNPYALRFSTGDSSSGSAAAVAANFAAGAVGMETYGSIVMPSSLCGSRRSQTNAGSHQSVWNDPDLVHPRHDWARWPEPSPTSPRCSVDWLEWTRAMTRLRRATGTSIATIGSSSTPTAYAAPGSVSGDARTSSAIPAQKVIEGVIPVLRELGAEVVDPVELPEWDQATAAHTDVMYREFRHGIRRYLSELSGNSDPHALRRDRVQRGARRRRTAVASRRTR